MQCSFSEILPGEIFNYCYSVEETCQIRVCGTCKKKSAIQYMSITFVHCQLLYSYSERSPGDNIEEKKLITSYACMYAW